MKKIGLLLTMLIVGLSLFVLSGDFSGKSQASLFRTVPERSIKKTKGVSFGLSDFQTLIDRRVARVPDRSIDKKERLKAGIAPHHLPTALPLMTDFYQSLSKNLPPSTTFIILGPSHGNRISSPLGTTREKLNTPFGVLEPKKSLVKKYLELGFVSEAESSLQGEHSIGAQAILIKKFFPKAQVVPLIIRSDLDDELKIRLSQQIQKDLTKENTFLVGSFDLVHSYPPEKTKSKLNKVVAGILNYSQKRELYLSTDSVPGIQALLQAFEKENLKSKLLQQADSYRLANEYCSNCTGYATILFR